MAPKVEQVIYNTPAYYSFSPPSLKKSPPLSSLPFLSYWCETVLLVSGEKVLRVFCVLYIGFLGTYWSVKSGNRYDGEFKEGRRCGRGKKYDDTGKLIEEGQFENNKFIG